MATIDIYPAPLAMEFPKDAPHLSHPSDQNQILPSISPPSQRFIPSSTPHATGPEVAIPCLPPLLRGHPDVHVHAGIIRAFADNEANGERAFFVADLSQVYGQYERWKRSLPDIDPFFGECPCQCSLRAS